MYFYEVAVTTSSYRGDEPLTYSSINKLAVGAVVLVPVRAKESLAVVLQEVVMPSFKTKPVTKLLTERAIPRTSLELMNWLHEFYPSSLSTSASQIIQSNLSLKKENLPPENQDGIFNTKPLQKLTTEQQSVCKTINNSGSSYVLHGDTGTGKTRVYIEIAQRILSNGKSVIFLTPEIGLTSQLASSLRRYLSHEVFILHSNLTPRERRILWLQCLYAVRPIVIVGPRSALLAPLNSIGLIVVDEFHDNAYKQEQAPYYNSLRVAAAVARIHGAKLIFGSATPPVTEYYYAHQKGIPILRMKKIAKGSEHNTKTRIVDARNRDEYTKNNFLSDKMLAAIKQALIKKEQSLVFLNRRGTARIVMCQDCDWQAICPQCDLPLTYHGDSHTVRCHTCGHKNKTPLSCPQCKKPDILFKSIGTKAIEEQLKKLFPDARVQRFDTDNTKSETFAANYAKVLAGSVDILVGTQMLVKGLDLPKLSVVGVVAADSSLYFPDYTAEEQTYQLLSQVIGRVSRGHRDGEVIVQTYNPDGPAQKAALSKDWDDFYKTQINERRAFMYPPFCFVLKLTCSRKSRQSAITSINRVKDIIERIPMKATIIGPAPRFNERLQGMYQWQLTIKSKQRNDLVKIIHELPANTQYDIDPSNLL